MLINLTNYKYFTPMELKNIDPGVSEMAQWSRALATLAGNLGLIPRTHMVASMATRHIAGAYTFRENRENIKKNSDLLVSCTYYSWRPEANPNCPSSRAVFYLALSQGPGVHLLGYAWELPESCYSLPPQGWDHNTRSFLHGFWRQNFTKWSFFLVSLPPPNTYM